MQWCKNKIQHHELSNLFYNVLLRFYETSFFNFNTFQDRIVPKHQMVYGAVPFNPYAHLSCPSGTTNTAPTFGYAPIHPIPPMGMFTNSYSNGLSNFTFNFNFSKIFQ